jgi:phosphoribosyl 1,2-cyclic phosphodiesterase
VRVFVLGSGSSGNALLVESCGTRVLVEAGIAPRFVASRLEELGVTLTALDGIVVSHRHGDHYGQAAALSETFAAPLFLHPGIARPDAPIDVRRYIVGEHVTIGALRLSTAYVPHDAAHVALRLDDGHAAFGIATDVGRVTHALVGLLGACDAALVEANHCTELLAFSEYPDSVKRRVAGGFGHLSNAQTAELASRLVGTRLGRMWLGHLSRSNNTEARALDAVRQRVRRMDVEVLPSSAPVAFDVKSARPFQLGLPF